VSSHTNRSVHAHERDKLKATHVAHGTMKNTGAFYPRPCVVEPSETLFSLQGAKELPIYSLHAMKSGNDFSACGRRGFHPQAFTPGPFAAIW